MNKALDLEQIITSCAFLFGTVSDPEEIRFKISAYLRIVQKFGFEKDFSEFELINELEEIDSFFSVREMRGFLNELNILVRTSDTRLKIREKLHMDDFCPGDYVFEDGTFPTDFFLQMKENDVSFETSSLQIENTLSEFLTSFDLILEGAKESPIDFVTPFYRPSGSASDRRFEYVGTSAASTPFLDLFLAWREIERVLGSDCFKRLASQQTLSSFLPLFDQYIDRITATKIGDTDCLAFYLNDDEDLPGAKRPSTVANGALLSASADILLANPERYDAEDANRILYGLTEFILLQQNDDGGWPTHRYLDESGQVEVQAESIGLVSLVCFAGLLDVSDHINDVGLLKKIELSAARYGSWLAKSASLRSGGTVAWENSSRALCPFETALSALGCHLAQILAPSSDLLECMKGAVRYLDENWRAAVNPQDALHRISLRAPDQNGLALLPIEWMNPGDSRVVKVLSLLIEKRSIKPSLSTVLEMGKATSAIHGTCREGFARRLVDPTLMEVSTTVHHATALSWFCGLAAHWERT